MKITSIETILDKDETDDGDVIKAVKGRIKRVWKFSSGDGDRGPWTRQGLIIGDSAGNEIPVTLWDQEEIPKSSKGKTIILSSTRGDHGWNGVKVVDESYEKDKKQVEERQLKITKTADVDYETSVGEPPPEDEPPPKRTRSTSKKKEEEEDPEEREEPPPSSTKKGMSEFKRAILCLCVCYSEARAGMEYVNQVRQKMGKPELSDVELNAATGQVFAEMKARVLDKEAPIADYIRAAQTPNEED